MCLKEAELSSSAAVTVEIPTVGAVDGLQCFGHLLSLDWHHVEDWKAAMALLGCRGQKSKLVVRGNSISALEGFAQCASLEPRNPSTWWAVANRIHDETVAIGGQCYRRQDVLLHCLNLQQDEFRIWATVARLLEFPVLKGQTAFCSPTDMLMYSLSHCTKGDPCAVWEALDRTEGSTVVVEKGRLRGTYRFETYRYQRIPQMVGGHLGNVFAF